MSDKFENPNFSISQENLDLVNRKERESKNSGGMTSSWTGIPDPELVPPDKMKLILESRQKQAEKERQFDERQQATPIRQPPSLPRAKLVTIPKQAIKSIIRLLPLFEAVQMNLTSEQSKMLLDSLSSLPTPKNMMDAKAIFNLMEMLSQ